ncbi:MAG: CoA-binding protein [Chitinophagaceae bacterium]|nr:CoA-binding protein [Chitinophagaceae bacterium]
MSEPKNKTLILGASANPSRYSYLALNRLKSKGHEVVAIGKKQNTVAGVEIETGKKDWKGIDTITVYLNPLRQQEYYDYILSLKPRRIIFNPGAENTELYQLAKKNNIKPVEACTLVMLSTGQY